MGYIYIEEFPEISKEISEITKDEFHVGCREADMEEIQALNVLGLIGNYGYDQGHNRLEISTIHGSYGSKSLILVTYAESKSENWSGGRCFHYSPSKIFILYNYVNLGSEDMGSKLRDAISLSR